MTTDVIPQGNAAPIMVGFDGSVPSGSALRWALREACYQDAPVELVHIYEWGTATAPLPAGLGWPDASIRREVADVVQQVAAGATRTHPRARISSTVVDGPVVPTLRALSRQARMVVVGHRGLGGFAGLVAGSVALGVATHAACPVVVVRGTASPTHPVIVGVDDSAESEHALAFAAEHAASRGAALVAVRAWQPPPLPRRDRSLALGYDRAAWQQHEQEQLEHLLEPWQHKYPQVPMRARLLPGNAAQALVASSTKAQLLVVGSRGRGGFRGLLLGSVARQLVQHARCPVAVVREATPAAAQ